LLQAVEYLHSHNPPIIHRDIKPANLKIGERGQIMLLDFGLAKGAAGQMNQATTANQSLFGYSRNYASLEQIQGTRTDPRSDLYSLGATLYHLFTGQAPPDALARQVALLNDEPDSLIPTNKINPNIPLPIASALSKAMALRPSERPHNVAEMRHSFTNVNSSEARTQSNPESSYGEVQTFIDSPRPSRSRIEISSEPEKQLKEQSGKVEPNNPPDNISDGGVLRNISRRFNTWLKSHNEEMQTRNAARAEMRYAAQSQRSEAKESAVQAREMTAAERVAEFMRDTSSTETAVSDSAASTAIKRSALAAATNASSQAQRSAAIEAEQETIAAQHIAATPEKPRRAATPPAPITDYALPSTEFLHAPPPYSEQTDEELRDLATRVAEKCREFNVTGKIEYICPGPVFTTFEFKPDPGISLMRMQRISDDIAFALGVEYVIIEPTAGKNHISIIVPNPQRDTIHLREVIESRQFREWNSKLTVALGKTIDGLNYIADLARMPHLLIAGATGAGKSVGVNTLIVSILYKANPGEVKFIMVDPKRLELALYADIPHLAIPIITDPKRASYALKWAVSEMERRYKELAHWGVRNIDGFNLEVMRRNLVKDYDYANEPHKSLPYLVIIIDELADLMMTSGHEVEESITRLAQMARAVGIHLVIATNRSSPDNITSTIKANFPVRIAFRLLSKAESQIILDANGAEQLLGRGDMLFLPPGTSRLVHVSGAYVDETEIGKIVEHVKAQGEPIYDESITQSEEEAAGEDGTNGVRDELYEDALKICIDMKRASTSVLQRRLRIGYGRAAAILDMMEREGLIGQADGVRPRPILNHAYEVINEWEAQRASEEM